MPDIPAVETDDTDLWRSAFLSLEADLRDLKRAARIACLMKQDDDRGADEEGLVWFSIEQAEEKAKALLEKWETLLEEAREKP